MRLPVPRSVILKGAIKVYDAVKEAWQEQHKNSDATAFAKAYREALLLDVQNHLGDPGYAPVASLDTEKADLNRKNAIQAMQEAP